MFVSCKRQHRKYFSSVTCSPFSIDSAWSHKVLGTDQCGRHHSKVRGPTSKRLKNLLKDNAFTVLSTVITHHPWFQKFHLVSVGLLWHITSIHWNMNQVLTASIQDKPCGIKSCHPCNGWHVISTGSRPNCATEKLSFLFLRSMTIHSQEFENKHPSQTLI